MVTWPVFEQSTPTSVGVSSGAQLFANSGCAACHGASGEGGVGPALAGHTAEQVLRQARRPLNVMPLFTSEELSDEELDQVAAFVLGLVSDETAHNATTSQRSALRAGSEDAAAAHPLAIIAAVGGEHEVAMTEALTAIEAGNLSGAESIVVEMLAGFTPDVSGEQILV